MHIAIAGNIGSGKTTLTRMLADHFHWTPKYESVDFNPYLADFYNDMERWSFNIQIYFLNKRFLDVVEINKHEEIIIQDRSIYEDACIFAPNLHNMGLMSTRDYENYASLFSLMVSLVKAPDLLIYLRSSIPHLVGNIQKRGREYESSIRLDYLKGLNALYEQWIEGYHDGKLLILDVDKLNFEENPEDFSTICDPSFSSSCWRLRRLPCTRRSIWAAMSAAASGHRRAPILRSCRKSAIRSATTFRSALPSDSAIGKTVRPALSWRPMSGESFR